MKKAIFFLLAICATWLSLPPKKAYAPARARTQLLPGDLLFSPIGRQESRYVGHVGIVSKDGYVVHSVPSGLMKDPVDHYYRKFRVVSVYRADESDAGQQASAYVESLFRRFPNALYKVNTPLGTDDAVQYCTKIVWQSYYYGAGINLGRLPSKMRAVHPSLLKRKRQLKKKS
ncbi:hypothetical protein H0266_03580 [Halobacillus locisalis]|uniref:Permuted papain-like amidase enzyme, YaeF/YiiX, C92 family n=1 Tax=Halobacillus locisalis TaxID=220753 RepID=A0A838CQD5_9BACI|nr:YiiX/YebB-like N1pC/P60 family cysteine hydrolase [Halobacillus locisalis]MBA2173975.1 hypothetical protein [Halobacillus locisalis]